MSEGGRGKEHHSLGTWGVGGAECVPWLSDTHHRYAYPRTRGPPWRLSDHWQWALKTEMESPSHPAAGEGRVWKAWGAHNSPECGFVLGDREATPAGAVEAHGFGRLGGM